ncbi:sugar transferase [Hymenobacter glaciei]|uniref:sugar transferase n=1 Tax=Hymenobacter glaciei TaxID=877209 RepID=UPI0031EB011A
MQQLYFLLSPSSAVSDPIIHSRTFTAVQSQRTKPALPAKRVFDFVFALLVISFVFSWLFPIIALLIKLSSDGPVFFKQLRTGKDGKPFWCLKFRSMRVNADSDKLQAKKGDARVTKVGNFLRKSSLDELPQFLNVLKGEMSVVGPRPHMLHHTEVYSQTIGNFMDRHAVMPGITGLAQVSGHRGEIKEMDAMVKRVEADIEYIKKQSLQLDVKIVLKTVRQACFGHENAY